MPASGHFPAAVIVVERKIGKWAPVRGETVEP
jgi:hypothetical protein